MSKHQLSRMSLKESKIRDDKTIAIVAHQLRSCQPFFLAQGRNGRVVHICGEHVAAFVDNLFDEAMAGRFT